MPNQQAAIFERLRQIGYAKTKHIRMYGEHFELISDPIWTDEQLVAFDAIERKSGSIRRVRIPLMVVNMLRQQQRVA